MYDRYIKHSLEDFVPLRTPDSPLPPPKGAAHGEIDKANIIQDVLHHFSLSELNTGDLLLLALFVFLLNKKANEELLIAMGLLLIL